MKKLKVLDLFCGAGGLSLGFEQAGFEIYGGVDFDKAAMKTHENNFNTKYEYCGDIKDISNEEIKNKLSEVDVIVGGPPCQGFSSANRYDKEEDDPRNKLFYEYLRFVEIIKPKAFIIENVKEILTKNNGYAKDRILEITSELGYKVSVKILLASDYGVPQNRRRAVFVGIRNDLDKEFDFDSIKKQKKVTVGEAIGDLCNLDEFDKCKYQQYLKHGFEGDLKNHNISVHNDKVVERIKHVPQGGNWKDVPEELWDNHRQNRHSSAYRRLAFNDVSITIDTGHMNYFHPIEHRVPSVRESARIQSFPDRFVFYGTVSQQYRQVGNAVPALLGKAIADALKKLLEE